MYWTLLEAFVLLISLRSWIWDCTSRWNEAAKERRTRNFTELNNPCSPFGKAFSLCHPLKPFFATHIYTLSFSHWKSIFCSFVSHFVSQLLSFTHKSVSCVIWFVSDRIRTRKQTLHKADEKNHLKTLSQSCNAVLRNAWMRKWLMDGNIAILKMEIGCPW